jgi:hypothetical protein
MRTGSRIGLLCLLISFSACNNPKRINSQEKNEVLVLGTIHSGHLRDSVYNIDYLGAKKHVSLTKVFPSDVVMIVVTH